MAWIDLHTAARLAIDEIGKRMTAPYVVRVRVYRLSDGQAVLIHAKAYPFAQLENDDGWPHNHAAPRASSCRHNDGGASKPFS